VLVAQLELDVTPESWYGSEADGALSFSIISFEFHAAEVEDSSQIAFITLSRNGLLCRLEVTLKDAFKGF
jgi:hypothetical protein